jgi:hypothetical protein
MASHPAAVLSDADYSVFIKLGEALRYLTPLVIGILRLTGGALVIMEAVQIVERQSRQWREMGEAAARGTALAGCGMILWSVAGVYHLPT